MLENVASNLIPSDSFSNDRFSVELVYRPSILENITNWGIFDDDQKIIDFLHSKDIFKGSVIDDEKHEFFI